jgi:hypothetical protein
MSVPLNYTTTPGQRVGIMIEYRAAKQDTFGLIASFAYTGTTGSCAANPTLPFVAFPSIYQPNSYRHDIRWALPPNNVALLPTSGGGDTYYDCDGIAGYDPNADSDNFIQNWGIWVHVTSDLAISVDEVSNVIASFEQNVPNPFTNNTKINFSLRKAVETSFTLTDLSGKVIMSNNLGNLSAGKHSYEVNGANLSAGVYYGTIVAGGNEQTIKMMVTK